jgi:hypothetical protein
MRGLQTIVRVCTRKRTTVRTQELGRLSCSHELGRGWVGRPIAACKRQLECRLNALSGDEVRCRHRFRQDGERRGTYGSTSRVCSLVARTAAHIVTVTSRRVDRGCRHGHHRYGDGIGVHDTADSEQQCEHPSLKAALGTESHDEPITLSEGPRKHNAVTELEVAILRFRARSVLPGCYPLRLT